MPDSDSESLGKLIDVHKVPGLGRWSIPSWLSFRLGSPIGPGVAICYIWASGRQPSLAR